VKRTGFVALRVAAAFVWFLAAAAAVNVVVFVVVGIVDGRVLAGLLFAALADGVAELLFLAGRSLWNRPDAVGSRNLPEGAPSAFGLPPTPQAFPNRRTTSPRLRSRPLPQPLD
jgi:hypothetical protein